MATPKQIKKTVQKKVLIGTIGLSDKAAEAYAESMLQKEEELPYDYEQGVPYTPGTGFLPSE